jgi:hypothetical protein
MLETVYTYHGCGVQHLHARFWPAETTPSAVYRRVSRLVQSHYFDAHRLPSLSGQGSGKALLSLGYRGRRVLAEQWGIPARALPRLKIASSALFVHHHFAICDFRVALELVTELRSDVQLVEWTDEAEFKRTPMKLRDTADGPESARTITLIPDGAFTLTYHDRLERGFLEMDMGTLAPKRLHLKLRGYLLNQTQLVVPIFFVTTSELRAQQVLHLAEQEAKRLRADPTVIFVTTRDRLTPRTILVAPIWQQAGVREPVSILPEASKPPTTRAAEPMPTSAPALAVASGQRS